MLWVEHISVARAWGHTVSAALLAGHIGCSSNLLAVSVMPRDAAEAQFWEAAQTPVQSCLQWPIICDTARIYIFLPWCSPAGIILCLTRLYLHASRREVSLQLFHLRVPQDAGSQKAKMLPHLPGSFCVGGSAPGAAGKEATALGCMGRDNASLDTVCVWV